MCPSTLTIIVNVALMKHICETIAPGGVTLIIKSYVLGTSNIDQDYLPSILHVAGNEKSFWQRRVYALRIAVLNYAS